MARPAKVTGIDGTPAGGVNIQKVGAIYKRTLVEGGAIYFENGVISLVMQHRLFILLKKWNMFCRCSTLKTSLIPEK
jgi:hypothetical protein